MAASLLLAAYGCPRDIEALVPALYGAPRSLVERYCSTASIRLASVTGWPPGEQYGRRPVTTLVYVDESKRAGYVLAAVAVTDPALSRQDVRG